MLFKKVVIISLLITYFNHTFSWGLSEIMQNSSYFFFIFQISFFCFIISTPKKLKDVQRCYNSLWFLYSEMLSIQLLLSPNYYGSPQIFGYIQIFGLSDLVLKYTYAWLTYVNCSEAIFRVGAKPPNRLIFLVIDIDFRIF